MKLGQKPIRVHDDMREARAALASVPGFSTGAVAAARFTRLRGLTNLVYKVEAEGRRYCLRIPGAGSAAIIDRRMEEQSARAAEAAGVTPELLYFGVDGLMLTRFVDDAVMLSPARFRESAGAIARAAQTLRQLHQTAPEFARSFDVFSIIGDYAALLRGRSMTLPGVAPSLIDDAERLRGALELHPTVLRSCHCDPTGANLLDAGERVWLVDWEYSGMNDPAWDLAYLSFEADFDAALDGELLAAYFGRSPDDAETGRVEVYKALCELLSALWALIQVSNGNAVADFRSYAETTFGRCRERMRSPAFARHLDAVRMG
jgi:thiamine kinase-like enzyme